jgi:hypothetical protein
MRLEMRTIAVVKNITRFAEPKTQAEAEREVEIWEIWLNGTPELLALSEHYALTIGKALAINM